jgi:hypothetical protein
VGGAVMKEVESNVTGVDLITLDVSEPSSLRPLSSQEEESRDSEIAEAIWTGDSTWHLRDTEAGLIYYSCGRLRNVVEHGGMGSQNWRIVQNVMEADGNYWKKLHYIVLLGPASPATLTHMVMRTHVDF